MVFLYTMLAMLAFALVAGVFLRVIDWVYHLRFYVRPTTGEYMEEREAWIAVGRHTNIYLPGDRYWVTVTSRGLYSHEDHGEPNLRAWLHVTRWRGLLALVEDFFGFGLLGPWLNRRQVEPRTPTRPMQLMGGEYGGER